MFAPTMMYLWWGVWLRCLFAIPSSDELKP